MNTIMRWGLILGVVCTAFTFLLGFMGWYKDPAMVNWFYLVILIQIVITVMGLRQTAAEGRGYGGQVSAGLLISLVGGIIIMLGSLLFTTVVFPDYFDEIASVQEDALRDRGMSDAEIQQAMDMSASFMNPFVNAIIGCVFTVIFGLIFSLIIAIFVRSKTGATRPQAAVT
jgi:hypothetical protein